MRERNGSMTTDQLREKAGLSNEEMCDVLELTNEGYEAIKGKEVTVEQFVRVRKLVGSDLDKLFT